MNNSFSYDQRAPVDPTEQVADAWLAYLRYPEHGFDPLRGEIEAMVCRLLKPRSLGGFFDSFFEGIVHQAVSLTLARFLTGNRKLVAATRSGDRASICAQLLRSIWLAMQVTMWRTRTITSRSATGSQSRKEKSERQVRSDLSQATENLGLRRSG